MRFLDRFKRLTDPRSRVVVADLKRLEEVKKGLGESSIRFVMSGQEETTLATLENSVQGNPLEAGTYYLQQDSPALARHQLLARQAPIDFDFTVRYAKVLAASCSDLPEGAAGTDSAHKLVRIVFSEVFRGIAQRSNEWPQKPVSISRRGMTIEAAVTMTERLGGQVVDLIDVLYAVQAEYGAIGGSLYRKAVDPRLLFDSHALAVIEACHRMHAFGRAEVIQQILEFELAQLEPYLTFLFAATGDGAKGVRKAAASALGSLEGSLLESRAIEHLSSANANSRVAMVELLSWLGTEPAIQALRDLREKEKTARVVSAIESALTVSRHAPASGAAREGGARLQAIDGSVIDIPALVGLEESERPAFGATDRVDLAAVVKASNAEIKQRNKAMAKEGYKYRASLIDNAFPDRIIALFNDRSPRRSDVSWELYAFLNNTACAWTRQALARLPQRDRLLVSSACLRTAQMVIGSYGEGPFVDAWMDFLHGPSGDLRHLEHLEIQVEAEISLGYLSEPRPCTKSDLLRAAVKDQYSTVDFDSLPAQTLWPYLAENLGVIDEALGLKPELGVALSRIEAIRILRHLPAPPVQYFGALLDAATGETKRGREDARRMLESAPGLSDRLLELLSDSRQAVRAGAADWIGARKAKSAVPALRKRLTKERSELAKAAILTALDALDEQVDDLFDPETLLKEAKAGLAKAKLEKLDSLALEHLPRIRYRGGERVPADVLKWWCWIAVKLKQPGGNALFDSYLDRLEPEDAESLSTWVFDSWTSYDTARPPESEAAEQARRNAESRYRAYKSWYKGYTREQAYDDLKREAMSIYLNSGAATKGLLALAKRADAVRVADRVRAYLKNHGSRTSQASAQLEMLASMSDPVALQVVIAAATRLKQKGVQAFAASLVEKIAEANSWSLDELGDRTIPSAGLDETGEIQLPCGPERRTYVASLDAKTVLSVRNPDGRVVKSLPSGQDDATKESKKRLSASRRELKQVIGMQSSRLYEALCSGREWAMEDWRRDLADHPVMRTLIQRVVWIGTDANGGETGFRPTAEGDLTDASDELVDLDSFTTIRLAYGAAMTPQQAAAWQEHLKDYEIEPLFRQFGRSLLVVDENSDQTEIDDRKGWVTDTFTIRGAASKLGYERGEPIDGGFFCEYIKGFRGAELLAVIEFSGNCLPEENLPAALISLSFTRYSAGRRGRGSVRLSEVPPVLLSECWNDYRTMAAKGAFDEGWEKKMPW